MMGTKKGGWLDEQMVCVLRLVFVDGWQPEGHVLAGRGHHHVLGVELDTPDWVGVVAVEDADLGPILRVPDVHPAVRRAGDDKLRVGRERGFQRDPLRVQVTRERPQRLASKRVYQPATNIERLSKITSKAAVTYTDH